jgi:hypothetical protein
MHDVYMRWYFDTTSNLVYNIDHGFLVIGLPEMRCEGVLHLERRPAEHRLLRREKCGIREQRRTRKGNKSYTYYYLVSVILFGLVLFLKEI